MFPRYFPYGQLPAVPNMNPLLGLNLGLPMDATSIPSAQDLSSLLLSTQSTLPAASAMSATSPYFLQMSHLLSGLPFNSAVNPLMAHINFAQMLPILNPNFLQQPTSDAVPTSEPNDPHTIVRAPVLYGNNNGSVSSQVQSVLLFLICVQFELAYVFVYRSPAHNVHALPHTYFQMLCKVFCCVVSTLSKMYISFLYSHSDD